MKVLLIGMDGCHKEVFKRGWTPFISGLLQSKRHLDLHNDLISRGWLEISLGQHATVTSALYDKPKANGSLDWTTKFGIEDVSENNGEVIPIWQTLNERGYSVGIMNVPTTFPAPNVNGFFVSGGGGGAPVVEGATKDLCFPFDILPILHENDYIVDNRLYELVVDKNLGTPEKIFTRLAYKNERRTDSFIELDRRFNVDFGFIVYKTSSVLAETLLNAEYCRRKNSKNATDESLVDAVRTYYKNFDEQVEKLSNAYPDVEIVFVSDHGFTERTHTLNPNILLQENGYQHVERSKSILKRSVTKIKEIIPFSVKAYLKKTSLMKMKNVGLINFNTEKTRAFCKTQGDWSHGIYINDKVRFGGPVNDSDFDTTLEQIVALINSNPVAIAHKISATQTKKYDGARLAHFPDIVLSLPDGYLTSDKAPSFIADFRSSVSKSSLASIMKGDILSIKSHTPLAYISDALCKDVPADQLRGDLTVVYKRVLGIFGI